MIPIPDSVAFYWADAINRSALNVLIGVVEIPADLTIPEAEQFELAHLAARRVRVEHWALLWRLWEAAWGKAVRAHLPQARLLTYGQHRDLVVRQVDPLADPSLEVAWAERAVCGVFDLIGAGHLFTWLGFTENDSEVDLRFYHWGATATAEVSTTLDLGADWADDGEHRRATRPGLLPIHPRDDGINPEPLATCTAAAMAALAAALRGSA